MSISQQGWILIPPTADVWLHTQSCGCSSHVRHTMEHEAFRNHSMGAYAILFQVLPCHSDCWFYILPNCRLEMIPGPPRTIICTKNTQLSYNCRHQTKRTAIIFFPTKVFFVSPSMMAKLHNKPLTWCEHTTSVKTKRLFLPHKVPFLAISKGIFEYLMVWLRLKALLCPLKSYRHHCHLTFWWSRTNTKHGLRCLLMTRSDTQRGDHN